MIRRTFVSMLLAMPWVLGASAAAAGSVDLVVVEKRQRTLRLLRGGRTVRTYRIALGFNPEGHKSREGDGQTPEGFYRIDGFVAESAFHRALQISYPNAWDRRRAMEAGYNPGGQIMIHGLPNGVSAQEVGHGSEDWTNGCIAVTNREIRELVALVPVGTPILIRK